MRSSLQVSHRMIVETMIAGISINRVPRTVMIIIPMITIAINPRNTMEPPATIASTAVACSIYRQLFH